MTSQDQKENQVKKSQLSSLYNYWDHRKLIKGIEIVNEKWFNNAKNVHNIITAKGGIIDKLIETLNLTINNRNEKKHEKEDLYKEKRSKDIPNVYYQCSDLKLEHFSTEHKETYFSGYSYSYSCDVLIECPGIIKLQYEIWYRFGYPPINIGQIEMHKMKNEVLIKSIFKSDLFHYYGLIKPNTKLNFYELVICKNFIETINRDMINMIMTNFPVFEKDL